MGKFMVGRKRRTGIREKNGRVQREPSIDPKIIAARQPHRQGVPLEVVHDPAAETNFGKLMLQKHITQTQYQAGLNWRGIVQRYRTVIACPKQDPVSMSGVIVGPWGGSGDLGPDVAEKRKEEYNLAFEALSRSGNRPTRAVNHWAIYDRGDYALGYLICGLNALAEHFGLTRRRKFGCH